MDWMHVHWPRRSRQTAGPSRPDDALLREMKGHWLAAIGADGPQRAADDAATMLAERSGCSREEGRQAVARAWRVLGLSATSDSARM